MRKRVEQRRWYSLTILGIVSSCMMSVHLDARAEMLQTDPNAMAGWRGFCSYAPAGAAAHVNYAVYLPGKFDDSFTGWTDPTVGAGYVYAYQLVNDSSLITDYISKLTVNLFGSGFAVNQSEVVVAGAGGVSSFGQPTTSAVWNFTSANRIEGTQYSSILIFTSLYGPEWDTSTIRYTGNMPATILHSLPRPVPEPSTLVGLVVATGGLFVLKVRGCRRTLR